MKLSTLSILLIFLLGSPAPPGFQQFASQDAEGRTSTETNLELTTRLVERKYCSDGGMLLILESSYKNIGEKNLILFKYASSPFEYRISRSVQEAEAKQYEQVISPMMGSSPTLIQLDDELPTDYYLILEPGRSHTPVNTITVPIFISDTSNKRGKDYLGAGEHVIQLNVSTSPFHNDNFEREARVRWQQFGILQTKAVLSLPMPFKVERVRDRSLSDCNSPTTPKRETMFTSGHR